jgi:hypothetical protein
VLPGTEGFGEIAGGALGDAGDDALGLADGAARFLEVRGSPGQGVSPIDAHQGELVLTGERGAKVIARGAALQPLGLEVLRFGPFLRDGRGELRQRQGNRLLALLLLTVGELGELVRGQVRGEIPARGCGGRNHVIFAHGARPRGPRLRNRRSAGLIPFGHSAHVRAPERILCDRGKEPHPRPPLFGGTVPAAARLRQPATAHPVAHCGS